MLIFPAIDILGGKAARLTQGDYARAKVYGEVAEAADAFCAAGAKRLHVVDLDGARSGENDNFAAIAALVRPGVFIQTGGGVRDMARVERYVRAGIGRVILGTAAVRDPAFLRAAVREFGPAVAVGVDTRDGLVAVSGWTEKTDLSGVDFCKRLRDMGVKTVIYTDIARDGLLGGPNLDMYGALCEVEGLDVVASGGVCAETELAALRDMGLYGAIVGKALYEGRLTLAQALCYEEKEARA